MVRGNLAAKTDARERGRVRRNESGNRRYRDVDKDKIKEEQIVEIYSESVRELEQRIKPWISEERRI